MGANKEGGLLGGCNCAPCSYGSVQAVSAVYSDVSRVECEVSICTLHLLF